MIVLPDDVWLEVAKYIPDAELRGFYRINSFFLNLAMNLRYEEVHLSALTTHLDRLLEHLKNDYIARRVRSLTLCPHLVSTLAFQEEADRRELKTRDVGVAQKTRFVPRVFRKRVADDSDSTPFGRIATTKSSRKVARDIETILQKCSCLNEFHCLSWRVRLVPSIFPPSHVWSSFSTTLRVLNLRLTSILLIPVLKSGAQFPCLEVFELALAGMHGLVPEDSACLPGLAILLSGSQNCLKSLSLHMRKLEGLSSFFCELGHFPRLQKLRLQTHLDGQHLPKSHSLAEFIRLHAEHLQELGLLHSQCDRCSNRPSDLLDIDVMLRNIVFHRLSSLHLNTIMSFTVDSSETLTSKQGLRAPLRSLRLDSQLLTHTQLEDFASSFAEGPLDPPLRHLYLHIAHLDKRVFDILSRTFPSLRSLTLVVSTLAGDTEAVDATRDFSADFSENGADYAHWKLQDFTVLKHPSVGRPVYAIFAMLVVRQYVPSIRTFGSNPSMLPIQYSGCLPFWF
ncbi:hypothetical protein HGRIS_014233 [Hohenbuehelia grisea]|uniref:F-box domain-containing protein n=1 Tax=Hohenbuehelia grisea TaxID=104357 RepID=A0ABR3JUX4_9AGAR